METVGTGYRAAAEATVAAMRAGAAVIYQAAFFDGRWLGFADFLRRVETPSELGPWSYEVWDTKLARHTKGSAVLQLSLYSEQLAALQGLRPELMHVALGGSARDVDHLRVADYAAYVRTIRRQFEAFTEGAAAAPEYPPATRPDPVEHCEICRWRPECEARRRETDDLSLVAGISAHQRTALRARNVPTRTALGGMPLPMAPPLEGTTATSLARVREQARIQVEGDAVRPLVLSERLAPSRLRDGALEPDRGLLSLPAPSPGDLFFDIEGDPFALDDGVDYLFGVLEPGLIGPDGEPTFHAWWSIEDDDVTLDAERRAFEALIDFFIGRLEADPGLHIYHYAPYEPTAMGRLMGRYGTRELEVDRLLREGIFVDLFRAVRQGVRASVESYSIKRLEPLYGFKREVDLRDAGSSIAAFEEWLELGHGRDRGPRPRSGDPGPHQALQPRRLREQPAAARLAGGPAGRAGGRSGPAVRRLSATTQAGTASAGEPGRGPPAGRRGHRPPDGRRAGGRQRPDAGPARVVAAWPAAELASPRGEVRLVALLLPHDRMHRRRPGRRNPTPSAAWSTSPSSGRWPGRWSTATASRHRTTRSTWARRCGCPTRAGRTTRVSAPGR